MDKLFDFVKSVLDFTVQIMDRAQHSGTTLTHSSSTVTTTTTTTATTATTKATIPAQATTTVTTATDTTTSTTTITTTVTTPTMVTHSSSQVVKSNSSLTAETATPSSCGWQWLNSNSSGGYIETPHPYNHNITCMWSVISECEMISFHFDQLAIDKKGSDIMTLRASHSQVQRIWSGTDRTTFNDIYSSKFKLKFTTDGFNSDEGFRLNWQCLALDGGCVGKVINNNGTDGYITSNNPSDANCEWIINTQCTKIQWSFKKLDIELGDDCKYDRVIVSSQPVTDPSENTNLNRYCGNAVGPVKVVNSSVLYVYLITDGVVNEKGFKLNWKCDDGTPEFNLIPDNVKCDGNILMDRVTNISNSSSTRSVTWPWFAYV